jgi:putative ABC transport system permease protein
VTLLNRLRAIFKRSKNQGDLNDELQFHLEKEIAQNVARGMPAAEARRQALIIFGGVQQTRENVRQVRWGRFWETLLQDVRFGMRMLLKAPGFTVPAIITLALGIGANTYVFSSADALLLRPLHFPQLNRLMTVFTLYRQGGLSRETTPADFRDWKRQSKSFESLSAFSYAGFNVTGGTSPEKVNGAQVSADFFNTLHVAPLRGRTFSSEDEYPGREQVAVISQGLWTRRWSSDPAIIGKDIQLNGKKYTVVGVVDRSVNFPAAVELWTPIAWTDEFAAERKTTNLQTVGRLASGASESQAQAELKDIAQRLAAAYPITNAEKSIEIRPLRIVVNGTLMLPTTEALILAAGLVLLLACANVATLQISRGAARQREMAVRAALGAGRWRLVRQLLIENALLATLGSAVAFGLATWAVHAQLANASPLFMRLVTGLAEMSIDRRSLAFMLATAVFTVVASGILPALEITKPRLTHALKESGHTSSGLSRHRLRSVLVALQIAFGLALLAGATLMGRGFHEVEELSRSFVPNNVLTFSLDLPRSKYSGSSQQAAFYQRVLQGLESTPGVASAVAFTSTPLSNNGVTWIRFRAEGQNQNEAKIDRLPGGIIQSISPGYFHTMLIPLLSGRDFNLQDSAEGQPVAIVSDRLARRFWPGQNPISKLIKLEGPGINSPWLAVVGVAHDVLYDWTNQVPEFTVYRPNLQSPLATSLFAVRSAVDPFSLVPQVRQEISNLDPEMPVAEIKTLEQAIDEGVASLGLVGGFVEALGVLALLLAGVGVYGVMAHAVAERTREIGIRMALGAVQGRVLLMVLRRGLMLIVAGVVIGWPLALALARVLANISYGVRKTEPAILLASTVILSFIALLACAIPARRATRVDPLVALRYE